MSRCRGVAGHTLPRHSVHGVIHYNYSNRCSLSDTHGVSVGVKGIGMFLYNNNTHGGSVGVKGIGMFLYNSIMWCVSGCSYITV